jgi:hypothetical protein
MPDYRAYILNSAGHFADVVPLECADDEDAKKQVEQLVDGHVVELWQRARKIARFDSKPLNATRE